MANYIIALAGVQNFFDDIDSGRTYWRDGESIVHSILTWAAGEGFGVFCDQHKLGYTDAHSFRQRHIVAALRRY